MTPIRADYEVRVNLDPSVGRIRQHANDFSLVFNQVDRFDLHLQTEVRILLSVLGDKIEKIPLRHEGDELALSRQMRKIGHYYEIVTDLPADLAHLLVRALQEIFEQAEFMHDLESGRMNCVAAKIAEKVSVFFQYHHVDARARQQIPEYHARRTTAGNATACVYRFGVIHTDKELRRLEAERRRGPIDSFARAARHIASLRLQILAR